MTSYWPTTLFQKILKIQQGQPRGVNSVGNPRKHQRVICLIECADVQQNAEVALLGQAHRGNPCYGLQGFPTELTPRVIPCCIVRVLEECKVPAFASVLVA